MFGKEVNSLSVFRLCREVDGKIVDLEEIEATCLEDALEVYWSWHGKDRTGVDV